MYLDHRVVLRIARILNMIDTSAKLLDQNGNVILPEGETHSYNLPEDLLANPTESLTYGAFTLIGTDSNQPVFVLLSGVSDETRKCAMLCAELINMLMKEDLTMANREQTMRLILRGEVEVSEYESLAVEHGIPVEQLRAVMYFNAPELDAESIMQLLKNSIDEADLMIEAGRHSVVVLRVLEDESKFPELEEYAHAIESTFLIETGKAILIGISDPRSDLTELSAAYNEARDAITIGRVYHNNVSVFVHRNMLLERFLSKIPADMSAEYNSQIFNRKNARLFNEEMIHTIEAFFDNSLNLSETARRLYIHRNTLVYRLEKVQKEIGLDLRNFDDAVTFKMMMQLGHNTDARKGRN